MMIFQEWQKKLMIMTKVVFEEFSIDRDKSLISENFTQLTEIEKTYAQLTKLIMEGLFWQVGKNIGWK